MRATAPKKICRARAGLATRDKSIDSLAKNVVTPLSDFAILKNHIDREAVEEHKDGSQDVVHKGGESDDGAKDKCRPVCVGGRLIVQFHHQPEQVHRGVQEEDHDRAGQIEQPDNSAMITIMTEELRAYSY